MSTPVVRAVLVTNGRSSHLEAAYAAIAALETGPTSLQIVTAGTAEVPLPDWEGIEHVQVRTSSFAAAANEAVAAVPAQADEFIWLLHDDTAPAPASLARLLATAAKRQRAAVIGPLVVQMDDHSRIVNAGATVTRLGVTRVGLAQEAEVNQGQYDSREDVLAVSLAGALIRREAWDALGGLDSGYRGFGESLEFCRRAWAAGWDVVIETNAVMPHAQSLLRGEHERHPGRLASHALRRVSEWQHALAWASPLALPVVAALVAPSAIVRAALRLAQHSARAAAAELAVPALLAGRLASVVASRRAHRRAKATGTVPGRLFASARQLIEQTRSREFGRAEQARASRAASGYVRVELDAARSRHRRSLGTTMLAGIIVSVGLGVGTLRDLAAGKAPSSAALGAVNLGLDDVWSRAWHGWSDAGLGSPVIDGSYAALMLPFAAAPGGLATWLTVLMVASPALAALAAWWAAGAATRSPFMRAAGAMVYACWPPALAASLDGRVGPVIAHLTLPVVVGGLCASAGFRRAELVGGRERVAPPRRAPQAAMVASLALVVATVAQPVLLMPAAAAIVATGALAGRMRWRVWSVIVAPIVVGLPGLLVAAQQSTLRDAAAVLARDPGPAAAAKQSTLAMALGLADGDRFAAAFASAGGVGALASAGLLIAGVAALLNAPAWKVSATGLAVSGLGFVTAAWSAGSPAVWPDATGGEAVNGWAGTGGSVVAIGVLMAALGAHGALLEGTGRRHMIGRLVSAGVGAAVVAAHLSVAVFVAWPGAPRGDLAMGDPHVLPLAVPLDQQSPARQRTLVLDVDGAGAAVFTVLTSDGSTRVIGGADAGPGKAPLAGGAAASATSLSAAVAAIAASGAAPVDLLQDWGIGSIVVAPRAQTVDTALSQNGGVSLVSASARGTVYRIGDGTAARAWVENDARTVALDSTAVSGAGPSPDAGGTLIIAVAADERWNAWADGVRLTPVADPLGRSAFVVPAGADRVRYEYRDSTAERWRWIALAALLWSALGLLPIRRPGDES